MPYKIIIIHFYYLLFRPALHCVETNTKSIYEIFGSTPSQNFTGLKNDNLVEAHSWFCGIISGISN